MNDTIDCFRQALATKVVRKRHGWNIKGPCFSHIHQALAHEGKGQAISENIVVIKKSILMRIKDVVRIIS